MSTRSRRAKKQPLGNTLLDELASIRNGSTKRSDTYATKSEKDVYDMVTEDEYKAIVKGRQTDGQTDFVVDDGGDFGYEDDGEEDEWEGEAGSKRSGTSRVAREPKRRKQEQAARPTKRVDAMLLGGRREGYVGPQSGRGAVVPDTQDDDVIKKMLSELDDVADQQDDEGADKNKQTLEDVAIFGQQCELDQTELEYVDVEASTGQSGRKQGKAGHLDALFGSTPSSGVQVKMEPMEPMADDGVELPSMPFKSEASSMPSIPAAAMAPSSNHKLPPTAVKKEDTGTDWFKISQSVDAKGGAYKVEGDTSAPVEQKTVKVEDGEQLRFYCYDIHEEAMHHAGTVFLFGRFIVPGGVETESCCVRVENLERNLFVLPRARTLAKINDADSVTDTAVRMQDVYGEIKAALNAIGVSSFKSKPVIRRYCFSREDQLQELDGSFKNTDSLQDPDCGIPAETQYLKVVYPFKSRSLPRHLQGKTFSKVLNTKSTARESFILKRKIMGPSWLTIKDAAPVAKEKMLTWCRYEFVVDCHKKMKQWTDSDCPEVPKLSVLSLSLQTTLNSHHRNEVMVATGMFHPAVSTEGPTADETQLQHFTLLRGVSGKALPLDFKSAVTKKGMKVKALPNERALLGLLLQEIYKLDPDVIVGHDLHGFQLETLLHRMNHSKIKVWSKIGRLRKTVLPNMAKFGSAGSFSIADAGLVAGRIMCDTMVASKEFLGRESQYSLTHLASSQLKVTRKEVDPTETARFYDSTPTLLELVGLNQNDCFLTLQLMFKLMVLPLSKTLTCLCGNIWNRSLRSARAERVEYLLLHEFHRLKFISPEKFTSRETRELKAAKEEARGLVSTAKAKGKKRGKAQYAGGLVLEPKKGFYDKFVLLLDFNSLYPSIVREFNICFTTINHWKPLVEGAQVELPQEGASGGVLPRVITRLLERRKAVKGLIKTERNDAKKKNLDIRQLALKLVANSMYGCLGFESSRFFCRPLAALITGQGRDILQKTVDLTNSLGYPVIYGDTDSIMVNTNQNDMAAVREIGKTIKKAVNKMYNILEIELDGVFKNMLLLKKKKYASLTIVERPDGQMTVVKELKGLDLVRRDWSQLSKDVGDFVLNEILSPKDREEVVANIHKHLTSVKEAVNANQMPLEKYIIRKGLTKAPADYPDKNSQPHVVVALKMIANGKTVRVGDHIPYIVCKGEDKNIASRAEHPDAIAKAGGKLEVDFHWYLSNQVLPPTARLLDPIAETDAARIADCLGLDSRRFHNMSKNDDANDEDNTIPEEDDEERFKFCAPVRLRGVIPGKTFELTALFHKTGKPKADAAEANTNAMSDDDKKEDKEDVMRGSMADLVTALQVAGEEVQEPHPALVQVSNQLTLSIRTHVQNYYQSQRDSFTVVPSEEHEEAPEPTYTARELYTQLSYFRSLFDVDRARRKLRSDAANKENKDNTDAPASSVLSADAERLCRALHKNMDQVMRKSAYHYVSLKSLFTFSFGKTAAKTK